MAVRAVAALAVTLAIGACGDDNQPTPRDAAVVEPPGVWVSALSGDDQNPGTASHPVQSITRGIAIAKQLGEDAVYVGQGDYPEQIDVVPDISLLGGHDCSTMPCAASQDPAQFVSTIKNLTVRGVLVPNEVTRSTTIDGFTIVGFTTGPGGAATIALAIEGSPTIAHNVIQGAYTTGSGTMPGTPSIAIRMGDTADPLIVGNHIVTGMGNTIEHEGIVASSPTTKGEIRGNQIEMSGASGPLGIYTGETIVVENDFSGFLPSSPLAIVARRAATIDRNTFVNAGTIHVQGDQVIITNNVILGGGIVMTSGGGQLAVTINSNLIDSDTGIYLGSGGTFVAGRIRNNIFRLRGQLRRIAILEGANAGGTAKPEVVENNVFWYADGPLDADDALWLQWNGSAATALTTIEQVNAATGAANNQFADPLLSGSHLTPGSPCIDTGTATEAPPVDIDDEARPRGAGFDIGPDEL